MANQTVSRTVRSRVLDETLAFLVSCGQPKLVRFIQDMNRLRNAGMLVAGPIAFLLGQIRENINRSFHEQDLLDYADEVRQYGPQHIFLFRMPSQDAVRLRELRDPAALDAALARQGVQDLFESPKLVWDSAKPTMASIKFADDARTSLLCKWVETRRWTTAVAKPQAPPVIQNHQERSVNFFRINLATGECELCLQKLHPNPKLSLQEEKDQYLRMAGEIFGVDQFLRVMLEPAIRRLLDSRNIDIRGWKVAYERGGYLRGARDPNLVQRINLFLTPFIAMELRGAWRNARRAGALVSLCAKNDELMVINHFDALNEMLEMLRDVRQFSEVVIQDLKLRDLAQMHEHLEAAYAVLDLNISRAGRDNLDLRRLAENYWIAQEDMLEAAQYIEKQGGAKGLFDLFRLSYQVICPDKNEPVLDANGKPLEFDAFKKIPAKVDCLHTFPQGRVKHPTKGNIKPLLTVLAPPNFWNVGLLEYSERPSGFLNFMQKQFGEKLGTVFVKILAGMVCTLPAVVMILGIGWSMLVALERFPDQEGILTITFVTLTFLFILVLFMFLITLFGTKIFKTALDGLERFIELVKEFIETVHDWLARKFGRKTKGRKAVRKAQPKHNKNHRASQKPHHGFFHNLWDRFAHRR